ncbi:phage/plasmid primase, P4 family [Ruminococcaceae bacterium OttesenSCG-928-O06]|nr:phage/plasmid primase, P4 family [Ruminococcaceae bacterium OttesenSCG-928-O06]
MVQLEHIPHQLQQQGLFCLWKMEASKNRTTKVPYNPQTGQRAKSNDKSTFAMFDTVKSRIQAYSGLGIGIFNGISAIDIDHCIDEKGNLSEMARDIIDIMDCYTERSPSGKGLHLLFRTDSFYYDKKRYFVNNQTVGLEVYVSGSTSKFLTITGDIVAVGKTLENRTEQLKIVLDKYMVRSQKANKTLPPPAPTKSTSPDKLILKKAAQGKRGHEFSQLMRGDISTYPSESEADLALCNTLAFWCQRDAVQMDRLFRKSGLMRPKWDEIHGASTYGAMTIQKAIDACQNVYDPKHNKKTTSTQSIDPIKELAQLHPESNKRYPKTDLGDGNLFADYYKGVARFVSDRKKWFIYDGQRWKPDVQNLQAMELCKQLSNHLLQYAKTIKDEDTRNSYVKHVGYWQRRNYRETILKDAASVHPILYNQFDKNPMLFNCKNGTLNLATGTFHAHRPDDLLSKISGVTYDPKAKAGRWIRFVGEVMQGDQELVDYFQKALGYALTGDTRHECFFMLFGPTSRNGKGTAMETYAKMMGEYASAARPESISQKNKTSSGAANEDIARLAGARFVNISEPDKNMVLSAAMVKSLTGNDTITARHLYEGSFEFKPQFKLFINTNYLPAVTDMTLFSSGRVKVIPFEKHFTEAEQDKGLKSELAKDANLSGLLNWCMEGLKAIEQGNFDVPQAILDANEEYAYNSDRTTRFIEDEMISDSMAMTLINDAYERYKEWCDANGHTGVENFNTFRGQMATHAVIQKKRPQGSERNSSGRSHIIGYALKPVVTAG